MFPIGILPRGALAALSNVMAFVAYSIAGYRRAVAMDNLRRCFPHKSGRELRRIARLSYRNLCDLMLNILRIRFASQSRLMRSVRFVNPEVLAQTGAQNGIVFAAHYSCWEYMGICQRHLPHHQTVAAYQPMSGAFNRLAAESRRRFGAKMAALSKVFRIIFEYRRAGKYTYTLMVTDQSPASDANNLRLTFLGQNTLVFTAPERIAHKTGSVAVYLRVTEIKRFVYQYEFVPLTPNAANEEAGAVMRRFFAELERDILRCPHLWMWTHRRWKHSA